MFDFNVTMA